MFGRVVDAEGLAVAEALAQRSTRQQGGMSLVRPCPPFCMLLLLLLLLPLAF